MKNFKKLLIVLFCLGLCFSCAEPDEFLEEPPMMLKKAQVKVIPSTLPNVFDKAEEDWQNITDALDNAGPGETVLLGEGTFYLHKTIVRWDFNGTLRGTGRNKTTIQTAPGILFDRSESPALNWSFEENDGHFMICFPHQSNSEKRTVTVSDLKIIINEPCDDYLLRNFAHGTEKTRNTLQAINVRYENLVGTSGFWGDLSLSDKINLNVLYKNISVIGEEVPDKYYGSDFSIRAGLSAFGASTGICEAKNIYMENVANGMLLHAFCGEKSKVIVKNFVVDNTPAAIYSFLVPSFDIKNNEFRNVSGWALDLYSNNPVVTFDMPKNLNSYIKNNLFIMDGTEAAIFGGQMNNVYIDNNVITGSCSSGIQANLGASWEKPDLATNWSIKNNDMCDLAVSSSTIILNKVVESEVKNNTNQIVGGSSADDPSNIISNPKECN